MTILQFPTIGEAESWLQAQGFRLVPDTCNWTNDAGDDAGVYSIDGYWGEVKGWRVEINRRSPKPAGGLSRRRMLAGLAAMTALPTAAIAATAAEPDPVFALIEAKRVADLAHGYACDVLNAAECQYGVGSPEAHEVFERGGVYCDAAWDACWSLATTPPTTLAGVAAVLRFVNELEDVGLEWPDSDSIGEGWHYQLRATMAQAIETIIRKGGV